ncbi:uncharacterized protein LOC134533555 [Bacillus rossius redtenbacheri]|uniref:uncharacterized protein LOC134533555 n=1 Tax=Bacillus rossius redtenbacheri TaxID=93214 RepID=UPI002FDEB575
MAAARASGGGDDKLVQLVRRHPAIYDAECRQCKAPRAKEDSWRAVAEGAGRSVEECKKRWRDIRDHYFKIKRKMKIGPLSSCRQPKWNLFESLTFLDGLRKERRSRPQPPADRGECEHTDSGEDFTDEDQRTDLFSQQPAGHEEPSTPRGRARSLPSDPRRSKMPRLGARRPRPFCTVVSEFDRGPAERPRLVRTVSSEDDVDAFFRSIALTVKKFTPGVIGAAKLKVLTFINELEQSAQYMSRSPSPA